MDEVRVKGYALTRSWEWVEETFTDEQKEAAAAKLLPELRENLQRIDEGAWYPVAWNDSVMRAVAETVADTPEEQFRAVGEMTAYAADKNLGTVMKLLVKFMKPETLLRQLGKFWLKYYQGGPTPRVDVDLDRDVKGIITLDGFPHMRYLSPSVSYWIMAALKTVGVDAAEVTETINAAADPSPSSFRWEIRW